MSDSYCHAEPGTTDSKSASYALVSSTPHVDPFTPTNTEGVTVSEHLTSEPLNPTLETRVTRHPSNFHCPLIQPYPRPQASVTHRAPLRNLREAQNALLKGFFNSLTGAWLLIAKYRILPSRGKHCARVWPFFLPGGTMKQAVSVPRSVTVKLIMEFRGIKRSRLASEPK